MFGPQADRAQLEIPLQLHKEQENGEFSKDTKPVYFIPLWFMYLEIQFPGSMLLVQIYYFTEIIHFGKPKD